MDEYYFVTNSRQDSCTDLDKVWYRATFWNRTRLLFIPENFTVPVEWMNGKNNWFSTNMRQ